MSKKLNKMDKKLKAFSEIHKEYALEIAVVLFSKLEKEDELADKINTLQAGLLAFAIQIRDKEDKDN